MSMHIPASVKQLRDRIQSEDATVRDAVTDTEIVQAAVALHPEYGGQAAVARLTGHDRSAITRALDGAAIALSPDIRAQLIVHLLDPETHPLPPKGPETRGRPRGKRNTKKTSKRAAA
jgi:hypothetical protein